MSDSQNIVFDDEPERPTSKVGTVIFAAAAVVITMAFLGSVGSPVDVPADSLPDLTAPPQQPMAIMPALAGEEFLAVSALLRDAGLDSVVLGHATWVANDSVAAGFVLSQTPAPGADIFDVNDIAIVMSSGGPVTSWDAVPEALVEFVEDTYTIDRSEPVLIVETIEGRAYKTDSLLFGSCAAIDVARNYFYDQRYDGLCQVAPPETLLGWLPDGSRFAIEGLPPQTSEQVLGNLAILEADGAETIIWAQTWLAQVERSAPDIQVEGDQIAVVGGFDKLAITVDPEIISAEELASLLTPVDIRGHLVINLEDPIVFGSFLDRAAARRYPQVDVVSDRYGLNVTVSESYRETAAVTTLGARDWATVESDGYQIAYPAGWQPLDLQNQLLQLSTFEDADPTRWCEGYPIGSLEQIGPDDGFVGIYFSGGSEAIWLDHFDPEDVASVSPADPNLECLAGLDSIDVRTSIRTLDGVALYIVMGFGAGTESEALAEAFAILDSFEPAPLYEGR